MITFKALGRNGNTGNSLFQFAALISIAKDKGYDVKIPNNPTYFDVNYKCTNYSILDGFNIKVPFLSNNESNTIVNTFQENGFHFQKEIYNIKDNTNLLGYFQSEKYFIHNKQYILDNLTFKDEIIEAAKSIFTENKITPEDTTSIHIRRGDFTSKQYYHPLMGPEYYAAASKATASKYYIVFSDDIDWCMKALGNNGNVRYSTNKNPFVDMCAMSMCSNNIIANSTFSWWGAWFNKNPNKVIVAPKKWFGPGYADWNTADLYPSTWLTI